MSQEKHSFTQRSQLILLEKKISQCTFNLYSLILLLVLEHNGIQVLLMKPFWHVDFLFIQRSFLEGYFLSFSLNYIIIFSSIFSIEENNFSPFIERVFSKTVFVSKIISSCTYIQDGILNIFSNRRFQTRKGRPSRRHPWCRRADKEYCEDIAEPHHDPKLLWTDISKMVADNAASFKSVKSMRYK